MANDLESQISELDKRRGELSAELATVRESIDSRTESVGADLLAGRNPEKGLSELAKLSDRQRALESAIRQAGSRLADLRGDLAESVKAEALQEYSNLDHMAGALFSSILESVLDLQDAAESFGELVKAGAQIASRYELRPGEAVRLSGHVSTLAGDLSALLKRMTNDPAQGLLDQVRSQRPAQERSMTRGEYLAKLWGDVPTPQPDMTFLDPRVYLNRH